MFAIFWELVRLIDLDITKMILGLNTPVSSAILILTYHAIYLNNLLNYSAFFGYCYSNRLQGFEDLDDSSPWYKVAERQRYYRYEQYTSGIEV